MTAARRGNGVVGHLPRTSSPARSLPPEVEEQAARKHVNDAARDRARGVLLELTEEALKGEGPALGLDPISLAEVHEGIAAELRRGVDEAKRIARGEAKHDRR